MRVDNGIIRSRSLPGGDLVSAVLDREVMTLADRGSASNLVGARWADLCADHAAAWPGQIRPVPALAADAFRVDRVARLDAVPAVAAAASRRQLQNPDLLLFGSIEGEPVVQAADAKFSVETARAKQVSPAVVAGLLGLRDLLPDAFGEVAADPRLVPGVFLCPDYPLTHLMLRRRNGIVRTTIKDDEVVMLPAPPDRFFNDLEGSSVMAPLAATDALPITIDDSLLVGLYYFRLARAAVGFWLDATKPLLLHHDAPVIDEAAIRAAAAARAVTAPTAFELILHWNADVQTVRNQRAAVDQVAALPLLGRDLRPLVARLGEELGVEPPSVNQVRRRVGAWWRGELRQRLGPLVPPVADLPGTLEEVARVAAELTPALDPELRRVVAEIAAQREPDDA